MLALQGGLNEAHQTNLRYNDSDTAIMYNIKPFCTFFSVTDELTVIIISKVYVMLWLEFTKPRRRLVHNLGKEHSSSLLLILKCRRHESPNT